MADEVVYVDINEGTKRVMNNIKLYVRLITKFKNDTNLNNLETAFAEDDMEKAQIATHTIKGLAANLSFSELFKQCLELETRVKAGVMDKVQLETVKTVFSATLQEIDKVVAENA